MTTLERIIKNLSFKARIPFLLMLFLLAKSVFGQTEEIASFEINNNYAAFAVENSKVVDNHLLIVFSPSWGKKEFKSIDLLTKEVKDIAAFEEGATNIVLSDSGAYYITRGQQNSTLRRYRIRHIDLEGNKFKSNPFTSSPLEADPILFEALYYKEAFYVFFKHPTESGIWKSSAQVPQVEVFYEPNNLVGHFIFEDSLVFVEHHNDSIYVSRSSGIVTPLNYASTPLNGSFSSFTFFKIHNQKAYFGVRTSTDTNVYQADFNNLSEFLQGFSPRQIDFKANTFRFLSNDYTGPDLYKGLVNNPSVMTSKKLGFAEGTQGVFGILGFLPSFSYFSLHSISSGKEMAFINDQDSIQLVKDLVAGKGSSLPESINGFGHLPRGPHTQNSILINDTLYAILTNGGDEHFYLYQVKDTMVKSLFKIDNPTDDMLFLKDGDYLYWFVETQSNNLKVKRRSLSDLDIQQPEMVVEESEEWFRQMNLFFRTNPSSIGWVEIYPKKVRIDKNENVFTEFNISRWNSASDFSISPSSNSIIKKLKNVHVFAKYDKYGQLVWMNEVGGNFHYSMFFHQFELDSDGNLIIVGGFFQEGVFDDLTVNCERAADFICKLDGETGKVLWQKNLFEDYYTDNVTFEGIALDDNNNVYIPVLYRQFKAQTVSGVSISSIKSPAVAMLKLDPDGEVIWFKKTETPWLDNFASTHVFNFNPANQTIVSIQNQMYYNTWMSCAYRGQNSFVQTFDLDGNIVDSLSIGGGNDMNSLTEATFTKDGRFFGFGYMRNKLPFGPYLAVTTPTENCYTKEGYSFTYDQSLKQISEASTTVNNNAFYPIDLRKTKNHIYVLGTDKDYMLEILKFSVNGAYLGVKYLNQWADLSEWQYYNSFDITESHIVILGQNFKRDTALGVAPLVNHTRSASILKIKNEGWINDGNRFQSLKLDIPKEFTDFVLFPNPFKDELNLKFNNKEVGFTSYAIHDVSGKFISEGQLNYLQVQKIDLSYLISGVYAITFKGPNKSDTRKIVKY